MSITYLLNFQSITSYPKKKVFQSTPQTTFLCFSHETDRKMSNFIVNRCVNVNKIFDSSYIFPRKIGMEPRTNNVASK